MSWRTQGQHATNVGIASTACSLIQLSGNRRCRAVVAEDAAELVSVEYQELVAVTDMRTALDPATPVIHPALGDNLAFERNFDAGAVDTAFADSDAVVEADFVLDRM